MLTPASDRHKVITDDELRSAAVLAVPSSWFPFSDDGDAVVAEEFVATLEDRCDELGCARPLLLLVPDPGEVITLEATDEVRRLVDLIAAQKGAGPC